MGLSMCVEEQWATMSLAGSSATVRSTILPHSSKSHKHVCSTQRMTCSVSVHFHNPDTFFLLPLACYSLYGFDKEMENRKKTVVLWRYLFWSLYKHSDLVWYPIYPKTQ